MNAREMIREEVYKTQWPDAVVGGPVWNDAACRVIERLQKRVEELETARKHWLYWHGDKPTMEAMKAGIWREPTVEERERYRDRLDRMVAAMYGKWKWDGRDLKASLEREAMKILAAIDAEVRR